MKKIFIPLITILFCTTAYSQDSMNKKMENTTDKMNKKPISPNDPMNKKVENVPDSLKRKRLPSDSTPAKRKTTTKIPVKKVVTR